ncbi:adenosylcobinamide-GDP ribazoletransferase [Ureibacillus terrenus]|uniref:Adenosylcobinamide-GDP ribazoletransferase n=2 Tax=Caryophanaceae TaxID=186818 RepID=A0A540V4S6_9BACL|nr:adenosylcobinamide-GDP ribazoletransferase [Ureibacillus terrenus]
MKNFMTGFLLSLQFFTSFPIRRALPMSGKTVTAMFGAMPFMGFLMGLASVALLFLNEHYAGFSPLFMAILVVVFHIFMTGGLHLDGWIDLGDAYFSYRDKEKRLEILSDSRVGAFGAIHLVVLILLKVGVFYEIFLQSPAHLYCYFVFIPVFCRLAMLIYFNMSMNVKQSGLAAYFKKQVVPEHLWIFILGYALIIVAAAFALKIYGLLILLTGMLVLTWFYRRWTYIHFGGMTGDLLGALYEGMELALWGIVLLSSI